MPWWGCRDEYPPESAHEDVALALRALRHPSPAGGLCALRGRAARHADRDLPGFFRLCPGQCHLQQAVLELGLYLVLLNIEGQCVGFLRLSVPPLPSMPGLAFASLRGFALARDPHCPALDRDVHTLGWYAREFQFNMGRIIFYPVVWHADCKDYFHHDGTILFLLDQLLLIVM